MSLNIKTDETNGLARELAELGGETVTAAVTEAPALAPISARRFRDLIPVGRGLLSVAAFIALDNAFMAAQFPLSTLARPFIDRPLMAIDNALGFDWLAVFDLTWRHAWLAITTGLIYFGLFVEAVAVAFFLGALQPARARRMLFANLAIALASLLVMTLWPVQGAVVTIGHVKPPYYVALEAARAGDWHPWVAGVIQFPSYHAALATLLMLALPRWPVVLASLACLATTPAIGGHYLVDLIAGAALAYAAWLLTRSFGGGAQKSKLAERSQFYGRKEEAGGRFLP